jgi:hypothetical protein
MKCENCAYYYREAGEDFPSCHFAGWGLAPCEEDDFDCESDETEITYSELVYET